MNIYFTKQSFIVIGTLTSCWQHFEFVNNSQNYLNEDFKVKIFGENP